MGRGLLKGEGAECCCVLAGREGWLAGDGSGLWVEDCAGSDGRGLVEPICVWVGRGEAVSRFDCH